MEIRAYTVGVTPGLGTVIVGIGTWPNVRQKGEAATLLARSALRTLSPLQTSLFSRESASGSKTPFGVALVPFMKKARRRLNTRCGRYMAILLLGNCLSNK